MRLCKGNRERVARELDISQATGTAGWSGSS